MKRAVLVMALAALIATPAFAQPYSVNISLGVRETGSTAPIGGDGGTSGSIEWVDFDNQTLVLDGTWQQFVFDLDMLPITAFTGNGVLDGAAGTIEHIRIKSNAYGGPISIWMDDLENTYKPSPLAPPTTVAIGGGFEAPYVVGDEVAFQEPTFSGSTGGLIVAGATSAVTDTDAQSGLQSYLINYEWVDQSPTRWLRLTTFRATNVPNATIAFDRDSVVSFWMKGVPEPTTLALLGLGAVSVLRRRR